MDVKGKLKPAITPDLYVKKLVKRVTEGRNVYLFGAGVGGGENVQHLEGTWRGQRASLS